MIPNMYKAMANSPALLDSYMYVYKLFRQESGFTAAEAEVVFLSILNRKPTEDEKNLLLKEMENSSSEELSDLIWALLNTPEFFFIK